MSCPFPIRTHTADVCVIGGGMAGLCAAIAAARHGAHTVLLHDRPVLGGNASSEIRMWICGARGKQNKETGILEEIQLANLHRNPSLNYSIWDSVLYEKACFQPNLHVELNCSVLDAETEGSRIRSVTGWQLTSQTWHTVTAGQFIDCSGDSILAPLTGAAWRQGRESREEFGEDIEPEPADDRTMGQSLLIQVHRTEQPQPYTPPKWAYRFESPDDLAYRIRGVQAHNFWWVEIGGLDDTIHDAEPIRDQLMRIVYGVWDYIKNRAPEREQARNWAVHWVGSHPGKRENRRYEGDHIMTQHDIEGAGTFEDVVAFGGWSMDDHHPAGLLYPGKPTIFHPAPSPYGIPYRSLYSRNVDNLLFAGRNISVTHAALSSTRVMATCAVLGQAVGTAAALCTRHAVSPRGVHESHLRELQQTLMDDDAFLPGFTRAIDPLAADAQRTAPCEHADRLIDGMDRDREHEPHHVSVPVGEGITFEWKTARWVGGVRLTFDSNLDHDKRMPCAYPIRGDRQAVPDVLVRAFRIEVREPATDWRIVHAITDNVDRVVRLPVEAEVAAVRLVCEATWGGHEVANVLAFEPVSTHREWRPEIPEGRAWSQVRADCDPADLAQPAKIDEPEHRGHSA